MLIKLNQNKLNTYLEEIKELLKQSYEINFEFSQNEVNKLVKRDIENINTYLSENKAKIYLHKINKDVTGLLWFYFHYVNDDKYIHLNKIIVHEDFRGNSISSLFLDFLFNFAYKNQVEKIDLNVSLKNKIALNIYKKRGFQEERVYMTRKIKEF